MPRYKYIREKREPIQIDYPLSGRTILSGNADNLIRCGGSLVPTDFVYDATEKEEREREREREREILRALSEPDSSISAKKETDRGG